MNFQSQYKITTVFNVDYKYLRLFLFEFIDGLKLSQVKSMLVWWKNVMWNLEVSVCDLQFYRFVAWSRQRFV